MANLAGVYLAFIFKIQLGGNPGDFHNEGNKRLNILKKSKTLDVSIGSISVSKTEIIVYKKTEYITNQTFALQLVTHTLIHTHIYYIIMIIIKKLIRKIISIKNKTIQRLKLSRQNA